MNSVKAKKRQRLRYMHTSFGYSFWPKTNKLRFLRFSLERLILLKIPWLADKVFQLNVDERFVEYPIVYSIIGIDRKLRILDIGCWGSLLPIQLGSLGHEVYGIDIIAYPLQHPNFTFVWGDICHMPFPNQSFDVVTAISTIEHIGLGRYGDPIHGNGDKKAVREIARVLKPLGKAIIAVPFGDKRAVVYKQNLPLQVVYDLSTLKKLFTGFKVQHESYWVKDDAQHWTPALATEAETLGHGSAEVNSIAVWVLAKKPER